MTPRELMLRTATVALAYAAVGLVALQLPVPEVQVSPVFPSAGIALAAVAVYGMRMLPAVWLGSVLTNVAAHGLAGTLTPQVIAVIGVVALGAAAQALLGARLACRSRSELPALDTPRSFVRFAALGALVASMASASVAITTFWSTGLLATADLPYTWWTWWIGDAIGVLIGAPLTFSLIAAPRSVWAPRRLVVGVPLLVVAVVMGLAISRLTLAEHQRNAAAFRHDAAQAALAVETRFGSYLSALHATHSLFVASSEVTHDEFRRATAHWLTSLPSLQAVGWQQSLAHAERARFERGEQAAGRAAFRVLDRQPDGALRPAADGDDYMVITYIEPEARNAAAIGVNTLSIPAPKRAIERSLRTREPVATAGFRLTQETGDSTGVVVYLAVRRQNDVAERGSIAQRGVVFVTIRMDDALRSAVDPASQLAVCVLDLSRGAERTRLAGPTDCDAPHVVTTRNPSAMSTTPVAYEHLFDFGSRLWMVRLTAMPHSGLAGERRGAWLRVFSYSIVGLALTGLLAAYLLVTSGHTQRIEREVAERTAALRTSEERFRTVFETASVGLTYVDLDGRVERANPRFCEIVGRPLAELQTIRVPELTHPDDRGEDARLRQQLLAGEIAVIRREKRFVRPDGSIVPVQVLATLERDAAGQPHRLVGVAEDITERLRLQEAEQGRRTAEASNRAKSEFLSRMSHELRTPLNAILGFAQLLEMDRRRPLAPEHNERIRQIQTAGWHLLDMINDVLDLSRIDAGNLRLTLASIDLHALVNDTMQMLNGDLAQHRLGSHLALAPDARFARGDVTRVKQVLTNLLSNAIKYNRPGGAVSVSTSRTPEGLVAVNVTDSGIGMSPAQLERLFEPFNRLGRETSARDGTGIGLVIARRLAELMGGTIAVHSDPASGSRFTFTLPAGDADDVVGSAPAPAPAVQADTEVFGSVLSIEDNASNAAVIRGLLAQRPHIALRECESGAAGLAAAHAAPPDLILLDLNLPDMSGLEVLAALKADPRLAPIPVIVVSADAMPEQVRQAERAGAAGYLTKPLRADEVLACVDAALRTDASV